jgi:hypothetical protein
MNPTFLARTIGGAVAACAIFSAEAAILQFDIAGGQMTPGNVVQDPGDPAIVSSGFGQEDDVTSEGGIFYDEDSGNFTFYGSVQDLSSPLLTAAIFGPASESQEASAIISLLPNDIGGGIYQLDRENFAITPSQLSDLNNGLWYVEVTTDNYPNGELRGQLTPVPEPQTFAMIAAASLAGFAVVRRYKAAKAS